MTWYTTDGLEDLVCAFTSLKESWVEWQQHDETSEFIPVCSPLPVEKYCRLTKLKTALCWVQEVVLLLSVCCRVLQMLKSSLQKVWRFGMLMDHVSSWISRVSAPERRGIWDQFMVSSGGTLEQNTKICTQVITYKYSLNCLARLLWHLASRWESGWSCQCELTDTISGSWEA